MAWDVQGNLSLRNGRKYDFDFGNRLREVKEAERYAYDAYGRRAVAYDAQGQRLRAMYSLAGQLVHEERRGKGASEYIHVGGRLLATRSPTGVTWTHVDALGSPVAVTDGTGSVVERRRFEPYGAESGGLVKDGPGYTGHVSDSATGLIYMQQRYMDPQLGVFLSVDPVTAYEQPVGQFHRYRYANNSPYRFTDPDGRQSVGEMIDSAAAGCGPVSCAGWATLSAAWTVLGAEGISQITDKGGGSVSGGDKAGAGLEIAAVLPPVKLLRGVNLLAKEGIMSMNFSRSQLQHAFKHAGDFGVVGNANNKTLSEFGSAIERHVASDSTVAIQGTYRGKDVTHFVDPGTGLNVMKDSSGSFLSGWKMNDQQLRHVLDNGSLGGGK
ncbi:TPA: colicin D domain-containing protein [Stenotrophomonas maltophilia]